MPEKKTVARAARAKRARPAKQAIAIGLSKARRAEAPRRMKAPRIRSFAIESSRRRGDGDTGGVQAAHRLFPLGGQRRRGAVMKTEGHIDRHYDERLSHVRAQVLRLGERVEELLGLASSGLTREDAGLADSVRAGNAAIERMERELDGECMVTLATRGPVASDLRFIMTAMKVATELGRIADLAKNVGERALEPGAPILASDLADLGQMEQLVRGMLRDAVAAFATASAETAGQVVARDREVNARFLRLFERTVTLMASDAESVRSGVHVQGIAKRYERMADHATRAAEAVLGMLDGGVTPEHAAVSPYEPR